MLNAGQDLAVVLQAFEVSERNYHRWRNQHGVDEQAIVGRGASGIFRLAGDQILPRVPLSVGHFVPQSHEVPSLGLRTAALVSHTGDGGDFVMHDVSFNNGHGADSDPNLDAFVVSAVNGNAVLVGSQFTLASGALPTVNADDSYTYNPNGAFESDISVLTHSRVARACRRAPSGTPHRSLPLVSSRGQYGVT